MEQRANGPHTAEAVDIIELRFVLKGETFGVLAEANPEFMDFAAGCCGKPAWKKALIQKMVEGQLLTQEDMELK